MNRRTKVLFLLLVCFGILSLISMTHFASIHHQNTNTIDLLAVTNQKRNSKLTSNSPLPPPTTTNAAIEENDPENSRMIALLNVPTRPLASQITLISSAIGLEPGSRVNRHRPEQDQQQQQQQQSGNPFRRQPKSEYSATVSFIQQHLHGMTDYLKHVYASHHGYNYILGGDEDFDEDSAVARFITPASASALALVDYARILLLEKCLLSNWLSLPTTSDYNWIVWMSTDVMIMNLDFQIETVLENVPSTVDVVVAVNKLEPFVFVAPPEDGNVNDTSNNKFLSKDSLTSKTRRNYNVDPGIMFFRRRKLADDRKFLSTLLERVKKLITNENDAVTACPFIPHLMTSAGKERRAWQCAISSLWLQTSSVKGDASSAKIAIIKNQRLFNSIYRRQKFQHEVDDIFAQEIFYEEDSTPYDDDDDNEENDQGDNDHNKSNDSHKKAIYSENSKGEKQNAKNNLNDGSLILNGASAHDLKLATTLFLTRISVAFSCTVASDSGVAALSSPTCLKETADEAFEAAVASNHLDMQEFKTQGGVFRRTGKSLNGGGGGALQESNNDQHHHFLNFMEKEVSVASPGNSNIAVLSLAFTSTTSADDASTPAFLASMPYPHQHQVLPAKAIATLERHQRQQLHLGLLSRAAAAEFSRIHNYDFIHSVFPTGDDAEWSDFNVDRQTISKQQGLPLRKVIARKKALVLAKTLLKYLPVYEWIFVAPTDAILMDWKSSLEKLLLFQLLADPSVASKADKDLIITSELKSASVSDEVFFIRNSRWTRKILKNFIMTFDPKFSANIKGSFSDEVKAKQLYDDLSEHSSSSNNHAGLIYAIAKDAVDTFWKATKVSAKINDGQKGSSPTPPSSHAVQKTLFVKDQHSFNSYIYPTDLEVYQHIARYNRGDFLGRLVNCSGVFTNMQRILNIRRNMLNNNSNNNNNNRDGDIWNSANKKMKKTNKKKKTNNLNDEDDSSSNGDSEQDIAKYEKQHNKNDYKHDPNADGDKISPQMKQELDEAAATSQINHCFNVADRMFEETISARYPDVSERKTQKNAIIDAAMRVSSSTSSSSPSLLSLDPATSTSSSFFDKITNPLLQSSRLLAPQNSRSEHNNNINFDRHVNWKNAQPGFTTDELDFFTLITTPGFNINENNNKKDNANSLLKLPTSSRLGKKSKKSTASSKRQKTKTTAILTVLCSPIAEVFMRHSGNRDHNINNHIVDSDAQREAHSNEIELVALHRQTFESKLAYAKLYGYDVIVEDCSVLESADAGAPGVVAGSVKEHKQWAKLIALIKWTKVYDRVLVLDPGMMIMNFDVSVHDLEKKYRNIAVMRKRREGAGKLSHNVHHDEEERFKHHHHQEPIVMLSSDFEGVSSGAMLWRRVTSQHEKQKTTTISTAEFLTQLLQLANQQNPYCSPDKNNADQGVLRCLLSHAISSSKNTNGNSAFNSLHAHAAVIIDTREGDADQDYIQNNRRGNNAVSQGTYRLLFGIPRSLLPAHSAASTLRDFRYQPGDFTAFMMPRICFSAEKMSHHECLTLAKELKAESHDMNEYGRIAAADEKKIPLLLRP